MRFMKDSSAVRTLVRDSLALLGLVAILAPAAPAAAQEEGDGQRREDLEKSLQIRKVKVAEKAEWVEGVEVEAQKAFRDGVVAVYSMPPDYKGAEAKFQEAIEKDGKFLEAYFNLGMVYERLGQGDKALEIYQKAMDANPQQGSAKAYIGKVYLTKAKEFYGAGDVTKGVEWESKAKKLLDEVIIQNSDNVDANNALALYWLMKAEQEKNADRRVDLLAQAQEYVQTVLTLQPANVVGLNTRGLIYLLRGELRIAKWVFENKVLAFDRTSTEAYNNLGLVYYKLGDTPRAVANFAAAINTNPDNIEARLNIAAIFLNYLNYKAAKDQYEYVLETHPDHLEAVIGLGGAMLGLHDFDKAFELYRKAAALDSQRTDLLLRIARLYQTRLVDFERAIPAYEEYIAAARKGGTDVTEAEKALDQTRKLLEQMKKMEEEMRKADEEAKKLEAELKVKAEELEKNMRKVESKAHDYIKKIDEFVKKDAKKDRKLADKAKKLSAEFQALDPQLAGIREYLAMGATQEAISMFDPVQAAFDKLEPQAQEMLGIQKQQKVEDPNQPAAPLPTGGKVEEPKAAEPKAEEPKAAEPKAAEPKAEEPKAEEPKAEEPKAEEPKAEEPKAEEPKAEEPKAEEPKAEN